MTGTALSGNKYSEYPEYKESGVEWLGNIPTTWIKAKFTHYVKIRHGYQFREHDFVDDGAKIVKITQLHPSGFLDLNNCSFVLESRVENFQNILIKEKDILMCLTGGTIGKIIRVTKVDEPLLQNYRVGHFSSANDIIIDDFVFYLMSSSVVYDQINFLVRETGQPNIGMEDFGDMSICIPSPDEQHKIADFLDHETAKIDTLIAKQEKLIDLLKEKRQAVISHAVTRGLSSNTPMKDSGIEWLGEAPEHWVVSHMDYVLNAIGDVDHYMPKSADTGIPYVMTGDLTEFASSINFEDCKQVCRKDYLKLSKKIKSSQGDVIMARYATIGTASYIDVDREFLVSYSCVTIKPNPSKCLGLYLFYYFKSHAFTQGIRSQVNSNTQDNVGVNDLKKVKVVLPPLTEQLNIIEYLQSIICKLDSLSKNAQLAINLMKERKTALISAAVTGKIDVRNWLKH
ncbi:restriction modification system DNA specificity domain-containing protein [Psychrosphaera saromensis]|uniref:Type I restriction modification DNA specificity domain-containing protein n=1 Tax=Psychrosphaera saromensis TaxID=716813 RepID=A0A2S7UUE5_9GAMM|nr:restriction endonuclease subunit S [Psychrosphaera saromensis]PQJ53142.1 hypothetical protein BTO11_05335 [Psychrosphaera saromensis]GHB67717.1 restriction modification system DNA specificity domain-containing protein [Psychrosphaera saromensis]GLQ15102.1 restriction modification system DNA specificity domain-containing protein [Psychrosphaera saromensis]